MELLFTGNELQDCSESPSVSPTIPGTSTPTRVKSIEAGRGLPNAHSPEEPRGLLLE